MLEAHRTEERTRVIAIRTNSGKDRAKSLARPPVLPQFLHRAGCEVCKYEVPADRETSRRDLTSAVATDRWGKRKVFLAMELR